MHLSSTCERRARCRQVRGIRAFSLVEMVAATALIAGVLAPALVAMRDAMTISRETTGRQLLANYAVQGLESYAASTMQNWTTGTFTTSAAADGHPSIRTVVTSSDVPANGGIAGRLMHLRLTVYDDSDNDSVQDANELSVRLRTKVAKLATYENEAN
jgi:type II secretory pathway pseudopilin PulG